MNLSPEDAQLFHRLYAALQVYANRALNAVPGIDTLQAYRESSLEDKAKIRDALYGSISPIDSFISDSRMGLGIIGFV